MANRYSYHEEFGIHVAPDRNQITYSDGEAVERNILDIILKARNVASDSAELAANISDWPSEYHLSRARKHLLRPFKIGPGMRVLELGSGCGALTRYLGEAGATVVAVEGSLMRARITAARCRDLPNVQVYCDNIVDFLSDGGFDVVTLIGVLEYAPCFISGDDPIQSCLRSVRDLVGENGTLLLAIENKLGLKYFCGCREDHVGQPFCGVNDLYRPDGPVTLGKGELESRLRDAGFKNLEFFYPFPDYKLPRLILRESAILDRRMNIADLLLRNAGVNYPENFARTFIEELAWGPVVANGLLPDLANSFLVCATRKERSSLTDEWLVKIFNQVNRRARFAIETSIEHGHSEDELTVHRNRVTNDIENDEGYFAQVVREEPYIVGSSLLFAVHKNMAMQCTVEEMAACFGPWISLLRERAHDHGMGPSLIPGHLIDCIPGNLIATASGELREFDQEWISEKEVPLSWILVRGIFHSLIRCPANRNVSGLTYREFIRKVASAHQVGFRERDFHDAAELERTLQAQFMIVRAGEPTMADMLDSRIGGYRHIDRDLAEIFRWGEEIERIKATFSWNVTKPLRALAHLWRKLKVLE